MGTFTPELTFGQYQYGIMVEGSYSYKTIQLNQGVPDGVTIANQANTTVTAAAPYWNIERTTGGGAYDAAAVSSSGIVGNLLLTVNRLLGTFVVGVSSNPTLDNGFGNIVGFLSDGSNIFAYSFGSQVGGPFANKAFMFLRWNTGVDENMRFYTGDTGVFASSTLVHTLDLTGFGATNWKFKSSLNTAGARLQASLVAM